VPTIRYWTDPSCPSGTVLVLGYKYARDFPALAGGPREMPASVKEAAAPRFGPVNSVSGVLSWQAKDVSITDTGKALSATRSYRSDRSSGDAGAGWSGSYSESLSSSGDTATMSFADGGSVPFASDPGAGYSPAPGVAAGFTTATSGSNVSTPGRTGYEFDAAGQLTGMTLGDAGHRVRVDHAGGGVGKVTGPGGRFLSYSRDGGKLRSVTDSSGRSVTLAYSGDQLTSVTGVDGRVETYEYDAAGRLTKVSAPSGKVLMAAGYDGSGKVAWLEQLGQGRVTFTYEPSGSRTLVTYADGRVLEQVYDRFGRVIAERLGSATRHVVYDADSRVVASVSGIPDLPMTGYGPAASFTFFDRAGDQVLTVDPTGRWERTTYTAAHQPLVVTRSDGSTTTRAYDAQGRLTSVTDPAGKVWGYAFNAAGQPVSQTDPLGRTRTVAYQANGDIEYTQDDTGARTTHVTNSRGLVTSVTDPVGLVSTTAYTAWDATESTNAPGGGGQSLTYTVDRAPDTVTTTLTASTSAVTRYEYDAVGRQTAVVDAMGGRTVTGYDAVGRPVSVTDPTGAVTQQSYTPEGWISSSTDPSGAVTTYTLDPAGRTYRTASPGGRVTQTVYDRAGRIVAVWKPDGSKWSFGYDALGRQATTTTPRGGVWTTTYDAAGRAVSWKDPLGYAATAAYDAAGRVISKTDKEGVATTYAYDSVARAVTATDPLGQISRRVFDAAGRVTTTVDATGGSTTMEYDSAGQLSKVTDPLGAVSLLEYDLAGRQVRATDVAARVSSAAYDALGRVTSRTLPGGATESVTYDGAGRMLTRTDPMGKVWTSTYDSRGNLIASIDPLGHTSTAEYDTAGQLVKTTDPTGVVNQFGYDGAGRVAVTWDALGASWVSSYDADGHLAGTRDPAGVTHTYTVNLRGERTADKWGTTNSAIYAYTYDKNGQLKTRADPSSFTYGYDARGRVTSVTNALGQATTTAYALVNGGSKTTTTRPSGAVSMAWFDLAGRLTLAADPLGNTGSYTYAADGQLLTVTKPGGGVYRWSYDTAGRVATATDPLGGVIGYDYDAAGRPTSITYPTGRVISSGYDDAGRMVSSTATAPGKPIQGFVYGYDDAGRPTTAAASPAAPGVPTLGWSYNSRGQPATVTDATGTRELSWDIAGRVSATTSPTGALTTFLYDTGRGQPSGIRGAVNIDLSYRPDGQLLTRTGVAPTSGNESRTYDTAGRLTGISGAGYTGSYTYTTDGQLASVSEPVAATSKVTRYGYDTAGRLLSAVTTQDATTVASESYTWDNDGNRTGANVTGRPATTSTFNQAGQITSDSTGTTHTYDADGLLAARGTSTYEYDNYLDLTSATSGGTNVTYRRDALGRLATRTSGGQTGAYSYTSSGALRGYTSAGGAYTEMMRTPTGDLLAVAPAGGTVQQAFTNIHDDLVTLREHSGTTITYSTRYEAFGTQRDTTGVPTAIGYQGSLTDPLTGLVDMGFRQYDTATGAFTRADTVIGDLNAPGTLSRYSYGFGDPINTVDPSGHWPDWLDEKVNEARERFSTAVATVSAAWSTTSSAVSGVVTASADKAREAWHSAATAISAAKESFGAGVRSSAAATAEGAKAVGQFVSEHKAEIASVAVGVTVFAVCEAGAVAFTGGAATPLCGAAAGAIAGAVNGAMTCADHDREACITTRAVVGGIGGLGAGYGALGGAVTAGLASSVDQLRENGAIDPKRLAADTILGGAMGRLGGRSKPATAGEREIAQEAKVVKRSLDDDVRPSPQRPAANEPGSVSARTASQLCSFDGATLVLMADGSKKPIEDVRLGDKVLATDPETGEQVAKRVEQVFVHDDDLTDLQLTDGTVLTTTENHPYWSIDAQRFKPANQLQPGERVLGANGKPVAVSGLRLTTTHVGKAYNLEIKDIHTYHVGKDAILVHNMCGTAAKADIPLPVRPPGHTVDVSVHGPDGRVLDSYSLHSGSMSPGEQALGFPQGPLASHTENRVARVSGASSSPAVSGDPFAGLRPVSSGDYVVIQGTKPPCPSCQGALNRAQVETGATFVYVWNGGRSWWQAGRPLG
jgi:RHS repeat-associated protein